MICDLTDLSTQRRPGTVRLQQENTLMKTVSFIQRSAGGHWVGDGFPVRSMFSYNDRPERFSPFLMLDYGGPTRFEPTTKQRGVGQHPHRGFETVTIVYDGEVSHRDSSGGGGTIGPGEVQWMTAASGIVHEEYHGERFAQSGGAFEMVQLWVNLPARDKMAAPGYQGITREQIPEVALPDGAGTARIIAGELLGAKGPAHTFTPMQVWDLRLKAGHTVTLPAAAGHTTAPLVLRGRVRLSDGKEVVAANLPVFSRDGEGVTLEVLDDSTVLWLSGEPIDEPVVGYGPFVMNTEAEIHQAFTDFQSGKMGRITAEVEVVDLSAALRYKARDGQVYNLNLIDTPGHVDFSYEVSRSLSACEGALLVVDASQGVEAQTVANCYTALDLGVEVVPVLNKMDLPNADPENAKSEIEDVIGIDATDAIPCSAKTGMGVEDILEAVVARIPPPKGNPDAPLRAMIVDSWYDAYVGVVMLVRVVDGRLLKNERFKMMATNTVYNADSMGVFTPGNEPRESLQAGEVGYIIAGIKELQAAKVGDTITLEKKLPNNLGPAEEALPGFKEIQPQVFAGLYPTEANQYDSLRDALEKLKLNDASLQYEPEVSQALGFGFRCGFLGLLHMEIVQERLEREFDQDLITTAPSVVYEVVKGDGEVIMVENPSKMPEQGRIQEIREPIVTVHLYMPQDYVGPVMTLANQKRGVQMNMAYHGRQVMLTYEMPLGEIVLDFFDKLKSVSRGYASMDYEFKEYRASDVVKVDILLNGEKVDALSIIVHRSQSQYRGRAVVAKMREIISRQMYDV
eukprot:gene14018-29848_t